MVWAAGGAVLRVRPVVLFQIAQMYEKRSRADRRVVGALLGTYDGQGVYEATQCFPVQFEEDADGSLYMDKKTVGTCMANEQLANPTEYIIGWFSTGLELTAVSTIFHDFFHQRAFHQMGLTEAQQRHLLATTPSVHLTVDASLRQTKVDLHAYIGQRFGVPEKPSHGIMFAPIPVNVSPTPLDLVAFSLMEGTKTGANNTALLTAAGFGRTDPREQMVSFIKNLRQALVGLQEQVDAIVAGRSIPEGKSDTARRILALLNSLPVSLSAPKQSVGGCGKGSELHDSLVVSYLTSLAETQMLLNQAILMLA